MSRYVKRNRVPVAVAVIFLAVVLFGAWQVLQSYVLRERIAAKEAEIQRLVTLLTVRLGGWQPAPAQGTERQLTRDEKIRDLGRLVRAFQSEMPDVLAKRPGATPARQFLVNRALAYLDRASDYSGDDSELLREIAFAYRAIGDLQGNPQAANLGDQKGAVQSYHRAGVLLASVAVQRPADTEVARSLALIEQRLAVLGPAVGSQPPRPPEALAKHPSRPSVTLPTSAPHYAAPSGTSALPSSTESIPVPEATAEPPQWGELEPLYTAASAKVGAARRAVEDLRLRLEVMGQSVHPSLLTAASNAEALLQNARERMAQGDGAAARGQLQRAEQEALRLLRRLGR